MPADGHGGHVYSVNKLGEYKIIKNIAEGTFAVVKCEWCLSQMSCNDDGADLSMFLD